MSDQLEFGTTAWAADFLRRRASTIDDIIAGRIDMMVLVLVEVVTSLAAGDVEGMAFVRSVLEARTRVTAEIQARADSR